MMYSEHTCPYKNMNLLKISDLPVITGRGKEELSRHIPPERKTKHTLICQDNGRSYGGRYLYKSTLHNEDTCHHRQVIQDHTKMGISRKQCVINLHTCHHTQVSITQREVFQGNSHEQQTHTCRPRWRQRGAILLLTRDLLRCMGRQPFLPIPSAGLPWLDGLWRGLVKHVKDGPHSPATGFLSFGLC